MLIRTILLCSIFLHESLPDKISWCDYWFRRGITRAECSRPRQQHWSLIKTEPKTDVTVFSMPVCDVITDWSRCQRADHCPLGLLCWVKGSPCCTPKITNKYNHLQNSNAEYCPSPQSMGIKCVAKSTVNWCNVDADCHHFNPLQKCCPSSCGYNLCIRTNLPVDMNARLSSLSRVPNECPTMDALSIGCSRIHGTSWCHVDTDCYSTQAKQRHCCPTRCGYNVCLLRISANKWILA